MSRLLGNSRRLLGRGKSSEPEPFQARCLCGAQIDGVRQPDFQLFTCPSCGDTLCIFPQSPLPVLPGTQKPRPARQQPPEPPTGRKRRRSQPTPTATNEDTPPSPSLAERTGRLRKHFTVPRIVLSGVALVVVTTVWWQMHRAEMSRLREELTPTLRRGMQALESGDLRTAYQDLHQFVTSLDRLGDSYPDEKRYRQAYAEVAIVQDLLQEPLELALAGASQSPGRVHKLLAGKSVILDATVEGTPDGRWKIGFATFSDGKLVRLHSDGLTLFERTGTKDKKRYIFGARIDAIETDSTGNLLLRLAPASGVFLTEMPIFEKLHLTEDPATLPIAAEQKRLLDSGEPPEIAGE